MSIVLFSRPSCHLCDDARDAMAKAGYDFEEVDISKDPGLEQEYGNYVPVVEVGGRIVFHAGMDTGELVGEILPASMP